MIDYFESGACDAETCVYEPIERACDAPPANTCSNAMLLAYDAIGACSAGECRYDATESSCGALGCCGDACCEAQISNTADVGGLEETGLVLAVPAGTFNTDSDCLAASVLGNCERVEAEQGSPLCVCRMDALTLSDLTIRGSRGLVLLANESVVVAGRLSISGGVGRSGSGASDVALGEASSSSGGRGGSYGSTGGNGVATFGTEGLEPLVGGMAGQAGCGDRDGGGGGGALQISAGQSIRVTGEITAGGGGGSGGGTSGSCVGGAGGGSGGGILLEAPSLTMTGTLAANGGGGGGGGATGRASGDVGFGGGAGAFSASGGSGNDGFGCALFGFTSGGDGGRGSSGNSSGVSGEGSSIVTGCLNGTERVGGGGGGGGAGRVRLNHAGECNCSGTFSPSPSIGELVFF